MPRALVNTQQIEVFIILFPDLCFIISYFLLLSWFNRVFVCFGLQFHPELFTSRPPFLLCYIHGFVLLLKSRTMNLFPDFFPHTYTDRSTLYYIDSPQTHVFNYDQVLYSTTLTTNSVGSFFIF